MADRDFDGTGYTRIMNEMLDALMVARLTVAETAVFFMFTRFCYGYNRSSCELRWTDMIDHTQLADSSLKRALDGLRIRNILHTSTSGSKIGKSYKINSKISTWNTTTSTSGSKKKTSTHGSKSLPPTEVTTSTSGNTPIKDNLKTRKTRKTPTKKIPDNFTLTDKLKRYASDKGMMAEVIQNEFDTFVNFHASKGNQYADWNKAWYTWVLKSIKFTQHNGGKPSWQL